jgi:hypothetical protein
MKHQWLVERCDSLDARDVCLREMSTFDFSDEDKRKLVEQSEQLKRWRIEEWEPFIAGLQPADEVWRFRSPPETWNRFCGCAGYVVLRRGEIVRSLTTMRS